MKIVHGDELPLARGLQHRGGTFHYQNVLEGEAGTLGNFQLNFGHLESDFFSPRHRHNFEQYRFMLEGTFDFARDGKMTPGMFGYFPEGVSYGPQTCAGKCMAAVLQFGGASGSGYLARKELHAGMADLKTLGEFKDGVFRRREDVEGKRNMDGYQAIWEHVNKRPMVYPKPRYETPFFMDPANFDWVPVEGAPGVAEKPLGTFTERRNQARQLRLNAGVSQALDGRGIYIVLGGTGTVDGQAYRRLTTVYLDKNETAPFAAAEATQLLHFGLPNLDGLVMTAPAAEAAAA
jgi:hypothetical protein